ncbi:aquaporin 3 [Trypanosoma grayi]|uniref:aquaporin 3 n=1 Tax=Trypanosoma grayi TaxID=71804 RepID=UPI0004F40244|nr:aquaporin 3 [Trypanosoma grayi]KEG11775.1 aquaporin 3 [Trypanosoma grayi]
MPSNQPTTSPHQTPAGTPPSGDNRDFGNIAEKRQEEIEIKPNCEPHGFDSEDSPITNQPKGLLALQNPDNWPLFDLRLELRQYVAEFFGTFLMIILGNGTVAISFVNDQHTYLAITLAWGMAVAMGIYVSLGISGGHINPAVTFANAVWGRFPWRKVPGYVLAQFLGAFVGAACAYGIYRDQLDEWTGGVNEAFGEKGFGGMFCTYPKPGNSIGLSIWSEFICTLVLLFCVCAIFDPKNAPAKGYEPLAVGLLVFAIGVNIGYATGFAMNPARDFGPRVFSAILFGSEVFTANDYYFWLPIVVPPLGATAGVFLYSFCLPNR